MIKWVWSIYGSTIHCVLFFIPNIRLAHGGVELVHGGVDLFMEVFDLFMEVLTFSWRCSPASKWEIATLFFSVPPIRCPAQVSAATSLIG